MRAVTKTVFHGGQVFDGTGAPLAGADVVMEDGRIVAVGPGLDGDDGVDCAGMTVLPGLIDCHVHLAVTDIERAALPADAVQRQVLRGHRQHGGDAGRGRDDGPGRGRRRPRHEDGRREGPRARAADADLHHDAEPDGRPRRRLGGLRRPRASFFVPYPGVPLPIVDGPDEMRRRVRELVRAGADVIKVATSGGVLSSRDDPRHGHFRDAELAVLAEEAAAAGRFVMAHAQATDGIKAAVRNGIRSIEHGIYLDDEAIG